MKIRRDFVTNSSSSSFIIAYQQLPSVVDPEVLEKYPALACFNKLVDIVLSSKGTYGDTEEGEKVTTKEGLDEWYIQEYGYRGCETIEQILEDDDYLTTTYNECLNAINEGKSLYFKEVSYNDDVLSALIREICKGGIGFQLLRNDG